MISPDPTIRWIAADSISKLCSCLGANTLSSEIRFLTDTIVRSREPTTRAGCALALGYIHSQVGPMAAGLHIRQIHSMLMTLTNDAHPTVHFWALEGLNRVIESAGLTFSGYSMATLGLVAQQYIGDTSHHLVGNTSFSNMEVDFPSTVQLALCLDALINCFGPDLQEAGKPRALIVSLVAALALENIAMVQTISFQCRQHLVIYTGRHFDTSDFVRDLIQGIQSSSLIVRQQAAKAYSELCKVDASALPRDIDGQDQQVLWNFIDLWPGDDSLQGVMVLWLRQSGISEPDEWISKLAKMLTTSKPEERSTTEASDDLVDQEIQDEEVAGLGGAGDGLQNSGENVTTNHALRWQTRLLAVRLVLQLMEQTREKIEASPSLEAIMLSRIGDVVKMSFLSSTSHISSLRLAGLQALKLVLTVSGHVQGIPDLILSSADVYSDICHPPRPGLPRSFGAGAIPSADRLCSGACVWIRVLS